MSKLSFLQKLTIYEKEVSTIDSKYSKYSTEQLEVILTHLADPDEKELVKQELSKRYYNHYLDIIKNPEPQPQPAAPPEQEDATPPVAAEVGGKDEPASEPTQAHDETAGKPAEPLSLEEGLASIPEVAPLSLKMPASQETVAKPDEKTGPEKAGLKKFCFIATAAYGSPLAQEVILLQDFRDRYLACHALGGKFIWAYYCFSPYLARQIQKNKALKRLTRFLLTPVIFLIKKSSGQ